MLQAWVTNGHDVLEARAGGERAEHHIKITHRGVVKMGETLYTAPRGEILGMEEEERKRKDFRSNAKMTSSPRGLVLARFWAVSPYVRRLLFDFIVSSIHCAVCVPPGSQKFVLGDLNAWLHVFTRDKLPTPYSSLLPSSRVTCTRKIIAILLYHLISFSNSHPGCPKIQRSVGRGHHHRFPPSVS